MKVVDAKTVREMDATAIAAGTPGSVLMRDAGLEDVDWFPMSGGIVALHVGTVPAADSPSTSG